MSEQTDNLIFFLKPYGLTSEESTIYLNLLESGTLSALKISRQTNMARTKVYRILDKLIEKQLVVQEYNQNGFKFKANHPSKLNQLITQKEIEISALKESLPQTIDFLEKHINLNHPQSQILYYQGLDGLSQVNWNLLNAKKEFLSYEVDTADIYLPHLEAEKLRQALIDKNITSKTLMNIKELKSFSQIKNRELFQQIHFIPPKILTIKSDIFIYNDIFTICHYLDNHDIFCLEIKNQFLTDMQKQIFENLWSQSQPINTQTK
jgi:sugar-specific transcriptional regulator TrmB